MERYFDSSFISLRWATTATYTGIFLQFLETNEIKYEYFKVIV